MISSRTPEGLPGRCPVCGRSVRVEPSSYPTRDACCPSCGSLLRAGTPGSGAGPPLRLLTWALTVALAAGAVCMFWLASGRLGLRPVECFLLTVIGLLLFGRNLAWASARFVSWLWRHSSPGSTIG